MESSQRRVTPSLGVRGSGVCDVDAHVTHPHGVGLPLSRKLDVTKLPLAQADYADPGEEKPSEFHAADILVHSGQMSGL